MFCEQFHDAHYVRIHRVFSKKFAGKRGSMSFFFLIPVRQRDSIAKKSIINHQSSIGKTAVPTA
jgi:hypothetical protein